MRPVVWKKAFLSGDNEACRSLLPATPPNYHRIVMLNERGLLPEVPVTELEAGANRCAVS
jgi:hypothetical protein